LDPEAPPQLEAAPQFLRARFADGLQLAKDSYI
jgi:hypothetical protein